MEISPIRNDSDYQSALKKIEALMNAAPDSEEGDMLEILAILVEDYESRNFPADFPDPVEAIKFYMEQNNLRAQDLDAALGAIARIDHILDYSEPLNLNIIRKLNAELGIPFDILIKEPLPRSAHVSG